VHPVKRNQHRAQIRAVASPTQPGGGRAKKFSGGAKYLSSFLKFKMKNRRKSAEKAKA